MPYSLGRSGSALLPVTIIFTAAGLLYGYYSKNELWSKLLNSRARNGNKGGQDDDEDAVGGDGRGKGLGGMRRVESTESFTSDDSRCEESVKIPVLEMECLPLEAVEDTGMHGVLIWDTWKGGVADCSGLRGTFRDYGGNVLLGDVILRVNRKAVRNPNKLNHVLHECVMTSPEASVELQIKRQDQLFDMSIFLN